MTELRRRITSVATIASICLGIFAAAGAGPAWAESPTTPVQPDLAPLSVSITPSYQTDASLDRGGNFSVARYLFDLSVYQPFSDTFGAGLHLAYEYADFRFSSPAAFTGTAPWGKVHRLEFGGNVAYDLTPEWSVYVAPSVQFSREEEAGWGNALAYGGDLTVTRDISPTLTLGAGIEAFNEVERVWALPLVVVNWKITDRLSLTNPSHPGPAGQTGLELVYRIGGGWEAAAGVSYLSTRFRLNSNGPFRDGIAETSSIPAWGRLSYKIARHLDLDVSAGSMFGGNMSIDDRNGNKLVSDDYAPAPFFSVAFSARF
ncbi:MAG TPA: DUF6268 family outer membrane beta-barrel protein [Desulfuromonadaceae bacterium]